MSADYLLSAGFQRAVMISDLSEIFWTADSGSRTVEAEPRADSPTSVQLFCHFAPAPGDKHDKGDTALLSDRQRQK